MTTSTGSLHPIADFPDVGRTVWDGGGRRRIRVRRGASAGTAAMRSSAPGAWALRHAGLSALVTGAGFGAYDIPAIWHFQHHHTVWFAGGQPTYGYGPFEAHGITTTVTLLVAFLGACLVLAVGGALLLTRTTGALITLTGLVLCTPFWWGFNLPFAWITAVLVPVLLSLAWTARRYPWTGAGLRRQPDSGARLRSEPQRRQQP